MSELCQAVKSGVHSNPAVFMLHFMAVMGNTEVVGAHQVYLSYPMLPGFHVSITGASL
jgi:hypothetical protein